MVKQRGVRLVVKRCLDLLAVMVLLIPALPLLALLSVLIRLDSPGPAFFRQQRLGKNRQPFICLKLRTMTHGSPDEPHRSYIADLFASESAGAEEAAKEVLHDGLYKLTDDARVTRCGRFLRSSSIDELPQLLNVLRGEMSLVGPRPVVPYEVEHYQPEDHLRFEVMPGLTGLWQVSGRSKHNYRGMLDLDVRYVRTWSLWRDVTILVRTVGAVLLGREGAR